MNRYENMARLESILNDISEMETWIAELNSKIENEVLPNLLIEAEQNNEKIEIVSEVYWRFKQLNTKVLAKGFNFNSSSQFQRAVEPFNTKLKCEKCQKEIILESRTKQSNFRVDSKGYIFDIVNGKAIRTKWKVLCDNCKKDLVELRNDFGDFSDDSIIRLKIERQKLEEELREEEKKRLDYFEMLKTMPYREYLKTEYWKSRRQHHLQSVGFRCQVCNANDTILDVHHRSYIRRGQELFTDLIVLCRSCHELFHSNAKIK